MEIQLYTTVAEIEYKLFLNYFEIFFLYHLLKDLQEN